MSVTSWTRPLPAKLPARVHQDSGHVQTSWTGELRAVVDDDQLIIRRWNPGKGWRYFVEWRYGWEQGWINPGPLPRREDQGTTP